jgi:hypothetical protein
MLKTGKKLLVYGLLFGSTSTLLGCSDSHVQQTVLRAEVAPGALIVDALSAGQPEHYFKYRLEPATGSVHLINEALFPDYQHEEMPKDFQGPTEAIEACAQQHPRPQAGSPNGEYLASCKGEGTHEFDVIDRSNNKLVHWTTEKAIRGFAWAPNSNSVAVLTTSGRLGLSPLELLAFVSGHPVSRDPVSLSIWDIPAGTATEYLVRRNVVSSFTRILSWEQ